MPCHDLVTCGFRSAGALAAWPGRTGSPYGTASRKLRNVASGATPRLWSPVAQVCRNWWQVTTSPVPSAARSPAAWEAASGPLRTRVAPRRRSRAVNKKSVSTPVRGVRDRAVRAALLDPLVKGGERGGI